MKKILVTQRIIENHTYPETRECYDLKWIDFFKVIEYLPIIISSKAKMENYFNELDINGILLTGGNDLFSVSNDNKLSKLRDNFELNLIEYAIKNNKPIVGICRGMQIVGEFFGIKLKKVENHVIKSHEIIPNKNSLFFHELKNIKDVNSFHNYSIEKVPSGFTLSASSTDGNIEAIENNTLNIFCQMWHIERDLIFSKENIKILKKVWK